MILLRTLTFTIAVLLAFDTYGQVTYEWHWGVGSPEGDGPGRSKMDDSDNLYTIFEFADTADIDPGPQTDLVMPQRGRVNSLTKVNAQGELVWHHDFYGGDDTYGEVYDLNYNQMVLGFNIKDSLVYEHNGIREVLFRQPGYSACLIKMTLQGNITSIIRFATPSDFYFSRMILLQDGGMVVTATFIDTLLLPGIPGPFISYGKSDAIMMLLDNEMNPAWAKHFGGPDREGIGSLEVMNEKIYYGIVHRDTIYMPMQSLIPVPSKGSEDFVFGHLDLQGQINLMIPMGGEGYDNIRSIKVDPEGNMYTCGYFDKVFDFAGLTGSPSIHHSWNENDGFVAKYNPAGQLIWTKIIADSGNGGIHTIHLKRGNEIYLSGSFSYRADLNPGPDSLFAESSYRSQGYLAKLSTDGEFHWAYWLSSTDITGIREINVSTITGRIYLDGFYNRRLNCSQLPQENWIESKGGSDIFMIGLSEENVITASSELITIKMDVYPNPTHDHITIHAENEITSAALFDMEGRIVRNWTSADLTGKQISLQDLLPGMYIIRVAADGQQIAKKLIIQ